MNICTHVCTYACTYIWTDGHLTLALLGRLSPTVDLKSKHASIISAHRSMKALITQFFTNQMLFLTPTQQCQGTEYNITEILSQLYCCFITICQLCSRFVSQIAMDASVNDIFTTDALQRMFNFTYLNMSRLRNPQVQQHHCLHHIDHLPVKCCHVSACIQPKFSVILAQVHTKKFSFHKTNN